MTKRIANDSKAYLNSPVLRDLLIYIPWIDLSELPSYLDVSDICLAPFHKNPQHESGVANKIYDYMLGSRAIIASDCKPQRNLIEKHQCGLVYNNLTEFQDSGSLNYLMMNRSGRKWVQTDTGL
ncbi:MAG: hypothetical protein MZV63_16040 [Marinilabiliales bacterium]|nr:hypothetical protein [Marinilabiliales bacterium]